MGQEGLEYYYDRYLRGKSGGGRVEVNAAGLAGSEPNWRRRSRRRDAACKVTLDMGLQQEGEKAMIEGIESARAGGKPADAGAFVALDPRNGQVLAIGSSPTFDPNKFAKPLTKSEYAALEGKSKRAREKNRRRR